MHNHVPHLTEDRAVPCKLLTRFLPEVFGAPTSNRKQTDGGRKGNSANWMRTLFTQAECRGLVDN